VYPGLGSKVNPGVGGKGIQVYPGVDSEGGQVQYTLEWKVRGVPRGGKQARAIRCTWARGWGGGGKSSQVHPGVEAMAV
jgi:hypothetical protein